MSQILLKNSFGKVVFHIFTEIDMTQNENWLFGLHFKTLIFFFFFFFLLEHGYFSVKIYSVVFSIRHKILPEGGFLTLLDHCLKYYTTL